MYKTIVFELLKERTQLHEQLRLTRRLLPTLEQCALELKASHEEWMQALAKPGSDPQQTSSEALEIALKELEERLLAVSPPEGQEELSLDQAMAFLHNHHTPKNS